MDLNSIMPEEIVCLPKLGMAAFLVDFSSHSAFPNIHNLQRSVELKF